MGRFQIPHATEPVPEAQIGVSQSLCEGMGFPTYARCKHFQTSSVGRKRLEAAPSGAEQNLTAVIRRTCRHPTA